MAEPAQASGDNGGLEMRPFFNEVQKLRQVSRMRQAARQEADTAALSGPSEAAPPARLRAGSRTAAATPVAQEEPVLSPLAIQWGGHRLRDVEGAPFQFALGTFLSTVANMARGCKTLAAIWQSAWREGSGAKIATSKLKAIPFERLMALYEDKGFAESMWLDEMIEAGIGVL